MNALARKSALSYKVREDALVILEDFTLEAPKTKDFIAIVNNLKVSDKKVLLVLPETDKNVILSARNIQSANVTIASNLNTYNVLNAGVLLVTEKSLGMITSILNK